METTVVDSVMNPVIQYGFAGFCMLQFAMLCWMFNKLVVLQRETNRIISDNTDAISKLSESVVAEQKMMGDIRDRLIARPCIASGIVPQGVQG